jgi:splicing factor 3B subunit 2
LYSAVAAYTLLRQMGRMDIDYQVLHDAFFKFQTKPRLTIHGDLYYEVCYILCRTDGRSRDADDDVVPQGREFETQMKEKKPGHLSKELMARAGSHSLSVCTWPVMTF